MVAEHEKAQKGEYMYANELVAIFYRLPEHLVKIFQISRFSSQRQIIIISFIMFAVKTKKGGNSNSLVKAFRLNQIPIHMK